MSITIRHRSEILLASMQLVCGLALSKLDYCNSALSGLSMSTISILQHVQNCAARLAATRPHYTGVERSALAARRVPHQAQGVYFDAHGAHWPVRIISDEYRASDSRQ